MQVSVFGGSGFVGQRLIPALIAAGHEVRATSRTARDSQTPGLSWCAADSEDAASVRSAIEGCEVAYYLVHSMGGDEYAFEAKDRAGALTFATAAQDAGVRRVVYLGGLGDPAAALSAHLKSRHEVGSILREFGPPLTEFRAGMVIGSGGSSWQLFSQLVDRLPAMICPRWVANRMQPIYIDDAVAYLVAAGENPGDTSHTYEIGGPDRPTCREMMEIYARVRGLRRLLVNVPVLTPRLSSYWVEFVTDTPATLARPLIEGLKRDLVVRDPAAARRAFPDISPRPFEQAVRDTLAVEKGGKGARFGLWLVAGRASSVVRNRIWPRVYVETHIAHTTLSAGEVWAGIGSYGGPGGWPPINWPWRLRGAVDRVLGGYGVQRGGLRLGQALPGDRVDFWEVLESVPPRRLRLRALMRLRGRAELEFEVLDDGTRRTLRHTARYQARGLAGHAYWWGMWVPHLAMFGLMPSAILRRARHHASSGGSLSA